MFFKLGGFISMTCFVHLIIFLGSFPSSLGVLKYDSSVDVLPLGVQRGTLKRKKLESESIQPQNLGLQLSLRS